MALIYERMAGTMTLDLVLFNDRLYAHTSEGIFQSTNGGVSWESVYESLYSGFFAFSKLKIVDNVLYVIMDEGANLRVLRVAADGNMLIQLKAYLILMVKHWSWSFGQKHILKN